jgi:hypothetical protein
MRIVKGEKKGFGFVFPGGGTWSYQFQVWIDFDLPPDANPEWREHCPAPDPEGRPNCRTVRHSFASTLEEAQALITAWTPERLELLVSKPELWWSITTAVHSRGWMTKSGKAKWRRNYEKKGWIFAALANTDEDWQHGITREWIYAMTLWEVHGRTYDRLGKWWEPGPAPEEVQKHYAHMARVKEQLESPECPAPIQEWYKGMIDAPSA